MMSLSPLMSLFSPENIIAKKKESTEQPTSTQQQQFITKYLYLFRFPFPLLFIHHFFLPQAWEVWATRSLSTRRQCLCNAHGEIKFCLSRNMIQKFLFLLHTSIPLARRFSQSLHVLINHILQRSALRVGGRAVGGKASRFLWNQIWRE